MLTADQVTEIGRRLPYMGEREREIAQIALEKLSKAKTKAAEPAVQNLEKEREDAQKALEDLKLFAHLVWPIIEPGRELKWNWHLDEIVADLEITDPEIAQKRGVAQITDEIINVPPATTKSTLVSVIYPAWRFARRTTFRVLKASYGAHLSQRDNVNCRKIVESDWFIRNYKFRMADDQNAKTLWKGVDGGWSFSTSVGGAGTGEHPDVIIIDDPTTAEQAKSNADREGANSWCDSTLSTRGMGRGVVMIVIMQRLHEEDLTGHLLKKGGYRHRCFPMRFNPKHPYLDARDPRKKEGELLWPEVFPLDVVARAEAKLLAYNTAGQFGQLPAPQEGGLFKRAYCQVIDKLPDPRFLVKKVRNYDVAATKDDGDYTAGGRMGRYRIVDKDDNLVKEMFVLEHVTRGQFDASEVDALFLQNAAIDGRACKIREEQEPGSAGKTVCVKRGVLMVGYAYEGVPSSGDKTVRLGPLLSQAQQWNFYILKADWNAAFIDEVAVFPNGKNDDQVDMVSGAFDELTTEEENEPLEAYRARWG